MRRFSYKKFLLLFFVLALFLTLPPLFIESLRAKTIALFSPLWKGIVKVKTATSGKKSKVETENARLLGENHLLRLEIEKLKCLVDNKDLLEEWRGKVVQAQVIYREPNSFGSSLWINVGQETNHRLKHTVIEKNSPVLLGKSVVGAVDYVGKKESRIRLLTDSALKPSVIAWRQNSLLQKGEGCYLAKGIVHGMGASLWRGGSNRLKGTFFECADAKESATTPRIAQGDLLVTTGMDGVFPAGLKVATVAKVYPLGEGAYTYEIEATPSVGNMNDLYTVFVISNVGNVDEKNCQSK